MWLLHTGHRDEHVHPPPQQPQAGDGGHRDVLPGVNIDWFPFVRWDTNHIYHEEYEVIDFDDEVIACADISDKTSSLTLTLSKFRYKVRQTSRRDRLIN